MTKKEKQVLDMYFSVVVNEYAKALRGDDKFILDSCLAKFYLITDLKEKLENANTGDGD